MAAVVEAAGVEELAPRIGQPWSDACFVSPLLLLLLWRYLAERHLSSSSKANERLLAFGSAFFFFFFSLSFSSFASCAWSDAGSSVAARLLLRRQVLFGD